MSKALVQVPIERVQKAILLIRGEKVILDADLAKLYGVTTARLNQQVKRNLERFPSDFMLQLTSKEYESLMLQIATSKGRGGRRKLPNVFTEHGAIMAANVLNSKRAVQASVQVVRAFVRLRQMLASNAELACKLSEIERKYDAQFKVVFDALRLIPSNTQSRLEYKGSFIRQKVLRGRSGSAGTEHAIDTPLRELLFDCFGREVRLTDERLAHILEHPELTKMEAEITTTVSRPKLVRPSRSDPDIRLFYDLCAQTPVGSKWHCVVVKYYQDDAFVITA